MVRIKTEKEREWNRNYMRRRHSSSEGRIAIKKALDKWRQGKKGKAWNREYIKSGKRKEARRKYESSPEYKKKRREYWKKVRIEVVKHYGNKCVCCGEERYEFLSIDHINGGGRKHRKAVGYGDLYRWLRKENYPEGFRILCHNCNQSLGAYGYCPHKFIPNGYDIKTGEYVYVHAE